MHAPAADEMEAFVQQAEREAAGLDDGAPALFSWVMAAPSHATICLIFAEGKLDRLTRVLLCRWGGC